ncbi:YbhB/YbcL family Raf kinase inhibitor-like protein [Prauserella endophytica]|uniref:YbhB/YbcL family Raf kinase inhibitor-like protein n=1 Tax=Prauserella endophytica TaxID=1592324 RepID=A0ABY2S3X4_9PSEU|nr:YbhB/YbcL family Raf kinase inhibitor-like protein [Prauserella endophytica]
MPDPGSHGYDVKRARLRSEYEDSGVNDQRADRAANEELRREHPARPHGDPDRAAGPKGTRGTSRGDPAIDAEGNPPGPGEGELELRSAAFTDHTLIPDRYAHHRDNVSPPLEWTRAPDGTEELALVCEDPDAPGGTFTHWVVTGLAPDCTGADEGRLPSGATPGRNGFGELGWGGPQPPVGDEAHRYFFRLYAVDRPLGLGEGASAEDVHAAVDGHTLAKGNLVGLFAR